MKPATPSTDIDILYRTTDGKIHETLESAKAHASELDPSEIAQARWLLEWERSYFGANMFCFDSALEMIRELRENFYKEV